MFITSNDGETFVLEAGREFKMLGVNELAEPVYASPALVDGSWYFRTSRHLITIGTEGSSAVAGG